MQLNYKNVRSHKIRLSFAMSAVSLHVSLFFTDTRSVVALVPISCVDMLCVGVAELVAVLNRCAYAIKVLLL